MTFLHFAETLGLSVFVCEKNDILLHFKYMY